MFVRSLFWGVAIFLILTADGQTESFGSGSNVTLKITGDADENHYHPGDALEIEIGKKNPMDTGNITKVWFQIGLEEFQIDRPPFKTTYTIPEEEIGELTIYVLAESKDGQQSEIEQKINIEIKEPLVEIKLIDQDRVIELEGIGTTYQLHVRGEYKDGKKRSVTRSEYRTTYSSANSDIVTVTEEGLMKTKGYGDAEIIVRNMDFETRSRITVVPYK